MTVIDIIFVIIITAILGYLAGFSLSKIMWGRNQKRAVKSAIEDIKKQDKIFWLDGKCFHLVSDEYGIRLVEDKSKNPKSGGENKKDGQKKDKSKNRRKGTRS